MAFVCCPRRAHSRIGLGLMGWCPGIYICVGICGRVMHRDLWSYFFPGREEQNCGCFLCVDGSRVNAAS